ncbi:hypothetical protein TraAM80_05972, partial [Trypanosoma rangeli]
TTPRTTTQHVMRPQAMGAFNMLWAPSNNEIARGRCNCRGGAEGRAERSQGAPHDHARRPAQAPQTAASPSAEPGLQQDLPGTLSVAAHRCLGAGGAAFRYAFQTSGT